MNKEINLKIKPDYVNEYRQKYPLLQKEAILNNKTNFEEGTILNLVDIKNNFLARAYHGIQNKGFGWVLTYNKDEKINTEFFYKKFQQAIKYRKDFYSSKSTTAFRVFNGEGDGIGGLSIDYFDGYYLLTWYSIGIYRFKDMILDALKKCVKYKGIYQKKRFNTKGKYLDDSNDFICGEYIDTPIIVKENGVNFAIYLDDGPMVGVFLDQRDVRKTIRDKYVKNKTFLNTFSYTGAFSIFAKLGGASKTTSVDLANRSRAKTSEMFSINKIDPKTQNIVVEDVFEYFKYAIKKKMLFDMVVLDPPSFARSKKRTFSVAKDYVKLLKETIQITNKGGTIVASTNYANFGMMSFKEFIKQAFKELGTNYKIQETFSLPKDFKVCKNFRESNYLKVVFIKKI